ncbi:MAG TPA: CHAT domain-containing protein [Pyrinomonadaceae bacterium]
MLASIGHAYHRESKNNEKALEFFNKSLEIYKSSPNEKEKIADILSSVASVHFVNFDFKNALENWEKALTVYREIDNKKGQSRVLNQIGLAHQSLNNKTKAAEYANQNLAILQSPDFNQNWRRGIDKQEFASLGESFAWFIEHFRLRSIAETYELLENYPKSLESYEKALAVADSSKNSRTIRLTANKVAFAFAKLEKWDKAAEYYKKGLEISRAQGVLEDLADDLKDVGWALLEGGKPAEALEFQNEALSVYQSVGIGENRAFTPAYSTLLNEISRSHYALGNKRLAIFYGKRAVNAMQGERKRLQNLDSVSQKGFLETKEKHYRRLADWLIAEGRIVETEQVLAMLKNEEVSSYLRRDVSEADKLQKRTDLTASEKNALARYYQIADKIAAIGAEYDKLREKLQELQKQGVMPPPEQQNRYNELSEQVKAANNIFQAFLKQLADEFARRGDTKKDLAENLALQSDLKDLGEGVVFLYTLVGENRYRVILTAPQIKTDGKYEIKSVELDKKISDFRQIVRNPNLDPRPLGKELYDILIKPIEKGLDGAKAKTLLWSLDGNLRLLPLAALWDGKQYFGQKYQNVIFTLASRSRLKDAVSTDWRILGLGVSEAKTVIAKDVGGKTRNVPFYALPAVTKELASIVADEKNKTGILPGQILLNADFTEKNFQRQLLESYKVVHIASHFALNAGDATESFLLLGDGNALTLSEIKINPELDFAGVELLTLSACETAVAGKDSNGKEIEGFAYVAQQKGAKAILATLWSVADESTRLLMSEFYRLRKENPKLTKAEALQIAQNQMIDGKVQSLESSTGNKKGSESKVKAPQFLIDNQKPFAHPFYWSPFILIGNWK